MDQDSSTENESMIATLPLKNLIPPEEDRTLRSFTVQRVNEKVGTPSRPCSKHLVSTISIFGPSSHAPYAQGAKKVRGRLKRPAIALA